MNPTEKNALEGHEPRVPRSNAWTDILFLFLAAAYPVVALAIENWEERIAVTDVASLVAFSFASAYIIWFVTRKFSRDPDRRLLASVLTISWIGFYGYIVRGLEAIVPWNWPGPWAGVISGLGTLYLCYWILRRQKSVVTPARMIRTFIVILTIFQSGRFALVLGASATSTSAAQLHATPTQGQQQREKPLSVNAFDPTGPDIYLIILDAYTGSASLRRHYGFDNSPFLSELKARGFTVPDAPRANYAATFLSLASMLNWTYVNDLVPGSGRDYDPVYGMIRDNRTLRFLLERGYQHIFLPSVFTPTRETAYADSVIVAVRQSTTTTTEFVPAWLETTVWGAAFDWLCDVKDACHEAVQEPADIIRWRFEQVGAIASHPGPKFVFAHMVVPHGPFVFGESCELKDRSYLLDLDEDERAAGLRVAYREQVQCVNKMVLEMVDSILSRSAEPPIIVLQGDHGYGLFHRPPPIGELTQEQLKERFDIFAAYLLPDGGAEAIYPSISPVNVLPRILNHYFGTEIPTHDDRSYYSSWLRPYKFIEYAH